MGQNKAKGENVGFISSAENIMLPEHQDTDRTMAGLGCTHKTVDWHIFMGTFLP